VRKADYMNASNTLTEMSKKLASLPLRFHAGHPWHYGPSVDVQAYLVEMLRGKPFDQYLQQTIFDPLQMSNTGYVIPEADSNRFAMAYNRSDNGEFTRVAVAQANSFDTAHHSLSLPARPGNAVTG